eukprot:IDg11066t1
MADFRCSLLSIVMLLMVGLIAKSRNEQLSTESFADNTRSIDELDTAVRRRTTNGNRNSLSSKSRTFKKDGIKFKRSSSAELESFEETVPGGWESIKEAVPGQWESLNETIPGKWENMTRGNPLKWEVMKRGSAQGEWTTVTETVEENGKLLTKQFLENGGPTKSHESQDLHLDFPQRHVVARYRNGVKWVRATFTPQLKAVIVLGVIAPQACIDLLAN